MDTVHPQHHPVLGCGGIKLGNRDEIQSNTGRGAEHLKVRSTSRRCSKALKVQKYNVHNQGLMIIALAHTDDVCQILARAAASNQRATLVHSW
ncbi:hypothetical protein G3446_00730 [Thiorhodococcus minor]|uniref:Uncharacterized protein n=1 Tax=Thiorhodococcus minor TaxID=57489 RepID=A0A6M0JT68_9GAMM|nr:hypothetical protein [Thiorhodococcus minor]